ncbi:MAG: exodeoxyribonuclease VII small subunit [Candidatus Syntrophosphaera sp.]|nr:exodeoxyribonuclease VII small subunit [Candidatus Syntrophosphaera sp.]
MNEARESELLSFEKAIQALEGVVEKMTREQLSLDEMIALYEEGIGYLHLCQKNLEGAETKIRMLNARIKQAEENEGENG